MKEPMAEVTRFWEHNSRYGWKRYDTPEKRIKAATEWVPETKGDRVSKQFLEFWRTIYAKLPPSNNALKISMLDERTRMSVNTGCIVIHTHPQVQEFLADANRHPELGVFARGNPVRFSAI